MNNNGEMILDEDLYAVIVRNISGQALNGLWSILDSLGLDLPYPVLVESNFVLKRSLFFWVLKRLMLAEKLRFAKSGIFLLGTVDDQINILSDAFPESEGAVDGGIICWFFDDECPAGAVWVYKLEDGSEYLEWA